MSGKIQPTSLAGRLMAYFENNPDEELTTTDLMHKFGVSNNTVWDCLSAHKRNGKFKTRVITLPPRRGRFNKIVVWSKA